jgi:hypothetical protein
MVGRGLTRATGPSGLAEEGEHLAGERLRRSHRHEVVHLMQHNPARARDAGHEPLGDHADLGQVAVAPDRQGRHAELAEPLGRRPRWQLDQPFGSTCSMPTLSATMRRMRASSSGEVCSGAHNSMNSSAARSRSPAPTAW